MAILLDGDSIKRVARLSGNDKLRDAGKTDQAAGKVKQAAEKVVDKAKDAVKKARS